MPTLQEKSFVFNYKLQYDVKLVVTEAVVGGIPDRGEPEFSCIRISLHMNMGRLLTFIAEEEKSVRADS
jgi:hypothetical protein